MNNELSKAPEMVWHYTRSDFLPLIQESGQLIPQSEADIHKLATGKAEGIGNVKLLWFSSNQNLELFTAQLGRDFYRGMNWKWLAEHYQAIRFGISRNDPRLMNWKQTCEMGGTNRQEKRARGKIKRSARKNGADVSGWFTTMESIPLEDLRFQFWCLGEWNDED